MQKKTIRKMTLTRETLLQLEKAALQEVKGGLIGQNNSNETRCFVCD